MLPLRYYACSFHGSTRSNATASGRHDRLLEHRRETTPRGARRGTTPAQSVGRTRRAGEADGLRPAGPVDEPRPPGRPAAVRRRPRSPGASRPVRRERDPAGRAVHLCETFPWHVRIQRGPSAPEHAERSERCDGRTRLGRDAPREKFVSKCRTESASGRLPYRYLATGPHSPGRASGAGGERAAPPVDRPADRTGTTGMTTATGAGSRSRPAAPVCYSWSRRCVPKKSVTRPSASRHVAGCSNMCSSSG